MNLSTFGHDESVARVLACTSIIVMIQFVLKRIGGAKGARSHNAYILHTDEKIVIPC